MLRSNPLHVANYIQLAVYIIIRIILQLIGSETSRASVEKLAGTFRYFKIATLCLYTLDYYIVQFRYMELSCFWQTIWHAVTRVASDVECCRPCLWYCFSLWSSVSSVLLKHVTSCKFDVVEISHILSSIYQLFCATFSQYRIISSPLFILP